MPKFSCIYCKDELDSNGQMRTLFAHIKRVHGITKQELYDSQFKKFGEGICKTCKEPTPFLDHMFSYRESCRKCVSKKRIKRHSEFKTKGSFNCQLCGKKNIHSYNSHLYNLHNISSKEYYDRFLRVPEEGICVRCEKEAIFRVKKFSYGKYCSPSCRGKHIGELYSNEHSLSAIKRNLDPNDNFGKRLNMWKEYKSTGIMMRSSWERTFANLLDLDDIKWGYETKWFKFSNGKRYLPDFYLSEFNLYVEVKPKSFHKDCVDNVNFLKNDYNTTLCVVDLYDFDKFISNLKQSKTFFIGVVPHSREGVLQTG